MSDPVYSSLNIPTCQQDNVSLEQFPLLCSFVGVWNSLRGIFTQSRTHILGMSIALGLLTAYGRRTITRAICARGLQYEDWSTQYRFFSQDRWSVAGMEHGILVLCIPHLLPGYPLVVALDDSNKEKTGKKIPGSTLLYDHRSLPYAPHFSHQLRFLSMCVLITPYGRCGPARGIPIRFNLAPTIPKPGKKAPAKQWEEYRSLSKDWTLSTQASEQVTLLRAEMDAEPALKDRLLVVPSDGSYCNKTMFAGLPDRTVLIARARKDMKLFSPAPKPEGGAKGRKKLYGDPLPTPEEIRKDDLNYPWQTAVFFVGGKWKVVRYKTLLVLWKSLGATKLLRLIILPGLRYKSSKNAKSEHRQPAYLLVSDPSYPVTSAIQDYFHRWEIEVNHKDEKDIFGVGQAQVWHPLSVERCHPFAAMQYSCLLLASLDAYGPSRTEEYLPYPKWRNRPLSRPSALDLSNQMRFEAWGYEALAGISLFNQGRSRPLKPLKCRQETAGYLAQTIPKAIPYTAWSAMLYSYA